MAETLTLYECVLFLLALQILLTEGRPIKSMNSFLHQSKSANNVQESIVASNDDFQSGTLADQNNAIQVTSTSVDDFRPTSPGFSPSVGHPKQIITSSSVEHSITKVKAVGPAKPVAVGHNSTEVGRKTNLHQSKSSGFGTTSAKDDFRPTAPGYSPGVGHPKKLAAMASPNVVEHSAKVVKVVHSSTDINLKNNLHRSKSSGFDATASTKDDFRPTAPGYSPGVGHPKKPDVITSSNVVDHSAEIGRTTNLHQSKSSGFDATASATDDFRPTTPGYSPGVGHPKKPAVVTSSDVVEHSVTGFKDDYRPTQPGHSPGVGHKNSVYPEPNP